MAFEIINLLTYLLTEDMPWSWCTAANLARLPEVDASHVDISAILIELSGTCY